MVIATVGGAPRRPRAKESGRKSFGRLSAGHPNARGGGGREGKGKLQLSGTPVRCFCALHIQSAGFACLLARLHACTLCCYFLGVRGLRRLSLRLAGVYSSI
jgi:hypothetical protein